jgi:hypothetical protein
MNQVLLAYAQPARRSIAPVPCACVHSMNKGFTLTLPGNIHAKQAQHFFKLPKLCRIRRRMLTSTRLSISLFVAQHEPCGQTNAGALRNCYFHEVRNNSRSWFPHRVHGSKYQLAKLEMGK